VQSDSSPVLAALSEELRRLERFAGPRRGARAADYCLRSDQGNSDSFYEDGPGGIIGTTTCT
jgi:hypothetical protein